MPLFRKSHNFTALQNQKQEEPNHQTSQPKNCTTSGSDVEDQQRLARRLVFHAQLAHGSPIGKIANFTNVKELYQRIATEFGINSTDILFCTLNTPRVEMDKLLGGQIGLDDLIFAHVKGQSKYVKVIKDAPALGLTITDNGSGYAFIKRIKDGSVMSKYSEVLVGDHIRKINDRDMVGCRHYEVAKLLREFTEGCEFSIELVEPKKAFEGIAPRQSKTQKSTNSEIVGSGKATLRLRSKGPATVEMDQPQWEAKAVSKVDDLLESFLGIRDPELANTLVDLGQNKENPSDFAMAVDGQLADFAFPDDFIFDIWGAIGDAKAGRI